jgi:hypothetical protein
MTGPTPRLQCAEILISQGLRAALCLTPATTVQVTTIYPPHQPDVL